MGTAQTSSDPLVGYFVERLCHLLEREQAVSQGGDDELARLLVHKAIFSTWLDCKELGAAEEADRLMQSAHRPTGRTV